MSRLNEKGKAKVLELMTKPPNEVAIELGDTISNSTELKRPGEMKWFSANSPDGANVRLVKCPDGTMNGLQSIVP